MVAKMSSIKKLYILMSFLMGVPSHAAPQAAPALCIRGKIIVPNLENDREETVDFCHSADFDRVWSSSCAKGAKGAECGALKAAKRAAAKVLKVRPDGNPYFAFCKEAGGTPELIEIEAGDAIHEHDRCVFEEDGSFLDAQSFYVQAKGFP
jgi:hypothetical protein